jgi:hypothetical protein
MEFEWRHGFACGAALLFLGCASDDGESGQSGNGAATDAGPPAGTAAQGTSADDGDTAVDNNTTGTSTSTTSEPGEGEAPETKFDLGEYTDVELEGCKRIDFLFVIDNSGSMGAQQTRLLASFPGFVDAIQSTLETQVNSYHVGVVTSDPYVHNAPGCQQLGALVTQTGGSNSSNSVCTFEDGNRFMTENDDLSVAFDCAGRVGTSGSGFEQPITALNRALDGSLSGEGGCNENFLRDDAVLVVVVVTDDQIGRASCRERV